MFLIAAETVLKASDFGAARGDGDLKRQATTIVETSGLVAGMNLPEGDISERDIGQWMKTWKLALEVS